MLNGIVRKNVKAIELAAVLMRMFSFSLVGWLGPKSPFMFVWVFNTIDAIALTWCALLRGDRTYTLLNGFWSWVAK